MRKVATVDIEVTWNASYSHRAMVVMVNQVCAVRQHLTQPFYDLSAGLLG